MDHHHLHMKLKGAFPAVITPMTPDGDIDHLGFAANLQWLNPLGFAGYLVLGTTGEMPHLSEFERSLVVEVARREIPDSLVLIVGTGLAGTRITVEESRRAAKYGADVALVVTPNYFQKAMTSAALIAHYQAVADASPIPIMLYSVPDTTGVTIPPDVVAALAGHPNVVGMKNSGNDAVLAAAYRHAAADHPFAILAGSPYAAPGFGLTGDADGLIFAVANAAPETSVALMHALEAGDLQAVRQHSATLNHVSRAVGRFGIAGWKAAVEARGYHGGPARLPLRNLSPEEREQVEQVIQSIQPDTASASAP